MFEFVFDRRRVSSGSGARPVGSPVNWIRSLVIEISLPSTANRDTSPSVRRISAWLRRLRRRAERAFPISLCGRLPATLP